MADIDLQWFADDNKEDRTEEASEHKLSEARKEGRLAKSQDLSSAIVFLFCVVTLVFLGSYVEDRLEELMYFFFTRIDSQSLSVGSSAYACIRCLLLCILPFAAIGFIAGVVANLVQNGGFLFTTKTITPRFSKIAPKFGEYFKRTLFSTRGVFNVVKSILKVVVIAVIAFFTVRRNLPTTLEFLHTGGPKLALRQLASIIAQLLIVSAVVLVLFAILDYVVQRREFKKEMRMTKQEVKEEYKELEGDPEMKSRLDSAQRELLRTNMPKAVRASDVVITNPTHYAVALQWRQGSASAPELTAKGTDLTAQNIKKIASEASVPIVENKPLARSLYTEVEIGDIIPDVYLAAVATVYAQIDYINKNNKNGERG